MWTNNKEEQNKWIETYLTPYVDDWKKYGWLCNAKR